MAIVNSCVRIWDTGSLIPGKATALAAEWLKFRCTGELLAYVLGRVMTDPAPLICQSNLARMTLYVTSSTWVRIWDMAHIFVAIPQLLLVYDQASGAPECPGHVPSWLSLYNRESHSAINTVYTMFEFLSHNIGHGLTYSCQSRSLGSDIIVIRAHLQSAS